MSDKPRELLVQLNFEHSPDKTGVGRTMVTTEDGEIVRCSELHFTHIAGDRPVVTIRVAPKVMNWLIKKCDIRVIENLDEHEKRMKQLADELEKIERVKREIIELIENRMSHEFESFLRERYDIRHESNE